MESEAMDVNSLETIPRHGGARVWLEINLGTLKDNYRKIAERVEPCEVMAVLKANAYGLGVEPIAKALAEAGVRRFGVAELNEAIPLADKGLKTQIMSAVLDEEIPEALRHGIVLPIADVESARTASEWAVRLGKTAECHVKIDTGMGRLGILAKDAVAIVSEIARLPGLDLDGIFTHFPAAYQAASDITMAQIHTFTGILRDLERAGVRFRHVHIANSDAINNFDVAFHAPFNLVRTGINLHGSFDSTGRRSLRLKPVLTLKTRLMAVRILPAGSKIGYGQTCHLSRDTKVGTVSAGYADGLPLALSNRGHVLIRGKPCPILGRISMDYATVSLEGVEDAVKGDEVVCLGGEGVNAISVDDWAALKGTHPYDIICSFGTRVRRVLT